MLLHQRNILLIRLCFESLPCEYKATSFLAIIHLRSTKGYTDFSYDNHSCNKQNGLAFMDLMDLSVMCDSSIVEHCWTRRVLEISLL